MTNAWKIISQWLAYAVLILAACAAMLLGKADAVLVERFRLQATDFVAPLLEWVSRPIGTVSEAIAITRRWAVLAEENEALRRERDHLLQWQAVAQRLEVENSELKKLLSLAAEPEARFVTARVVSDPGGAFAHSLLVNAGERDGVRKGHIVVGGEGLVGRIAATSDLVSRILLISDLNSRVPVSVGPSRLRAVLAGDNSERLRLIHLDPGAAVRPGDRVVTSGITSAFPPGLPVGVVTVVGEGHPRVEPFVRRGRLEYVRVIDHRLPDTVEGFIAVTGERRSPEAASDPK